MKKISAVLVLLALLVFPVSAFAAGGNGGGNGGGGGQGDGSGGGQSEALMVESASVEEGAVLAPEDGITLVFSKNVVNASVAETNKPLFKVLDREGNAIAIEVVLADDQVEPDKKNDVVIQFPEGLDDGDYTLTAQSGITSKSGDVMAEDYTLSFVVDSGAQAAPADNSASASPESTDVANEDSGFPMVAVVVIVVVVAVVLGVVMMRRKK